MTRPFDFSDKTIEAARVRQEGRCAHCGHDLADLWEEAHHVVPNQSGDPHHVDDCYLKAEDNCVVLCGTCHYVVHDSGRYVRGGVAPAEYYPYSHGSRTTAHMLWAKMLESQAARTFARVGKP